MTRWSSGLARGVLAAGTLGVGLLACGTNDTSPLETFAPEAGVSQGADAHPESDGGGTTDRGTDSAGATDSASTTDRGDPTDSSGTTDSLGTNDGGTATDVGGSNDSGSASDASRPPTDGSTGSSPDGGCVPATTTGGVPLPACWSLKISDRFGSGPGETVGTLTQLHAKYYEGQDYNRDANGLVKIPNVVINGEQETYVHFETSIVFSADHLTIQARGHADNSISSAEMVSSHSARSWCVEGRYRIPNADKSWSALWFYGDATGHDSSEIDIEQPLTPNQGVHDVSLYNHPNAPVTSVQIFDSKFTTAYMTWSSPSFDASASAHVYTTCYQDSLPRVSRYIDGVPIYAADWKWNASLGGTGHGPDAFTIFNLAVGGSWPGNAANPSTYSADLDLYSLEYYEP